MSPSGMNHAQVHHRFFSMAKVFMYVLNLHLFYEMIYLELTKFIQSVLELVYLKF